MNVTINIAAATVDRRQGTNPSDEERIQQAIADAYYEDRLTFEQVVAIVGTETAQSFRVLKQQLTDDSITEDLAAALDE